MGPPKVRLHKTNGKLKTIPRPNTHVSSAASTSNAANGSTPATASNDADRQFELELYWCIQQLETSLNLPHVRESSKKVDDTSKLINTLKSANQPIIRKRQIMRTTFGDYRSKMAAEEQSLAVNPENVRFQEEKPTVKYHFVKKSTILNGGKDFRFNFSVPSTDDTEEGDTEKQRESKRSHTCTYAPSDNSFRFNFTTPGDQDP